MTTPPNSEPPNEPPSREAVEAAMNARRLDWCELGDMMSHNEGDYVSFDDYTVLRAEVQRLRALVDEPQGKQIKPGLDKPKQEPDLYCGACGQPSVQSLWFKAGHTAVCPVCGAEFVCGAGG